MSTTTTKQLADGQCYKTALLALADQPLMNQFKRLGSFTQPILIHGYPRLTSGPLVGSKYGHAWIECGPWAMDVGCHEGADVKVVSKDLYYAVGQIDPEECYEYSLDVARHFAARWEHAGPWQPPPDDAIFSHDVL